MFGNTMSGTRAESRGRYTWGAASLRPASNPGFQKSRLPSSSTARAAGGPQSPRMSSRRWATQTSPRWLAAWPATRRQGCRGTGRAPRNRRQLRRSLVGSQTHPPGADQHQRTGRHYEPKQDALYERPQSNFADCASADSSPNQKQRNGQADASQSSQLTEHAAKLRETGIGQSGEAKQRDEPRPADPRAALGDH